VVTQAFGVKIFGRGGDGSGELLPLRDDGIHVAHDELGKTHERLPEHESMDGDSNISPSGEKYTTADARLPGILFWCGTYVFSAL
jgi:hypothetical protein